MHGPAGSVRTVDIIESVRRLGLAWNRDQPLLLAVIPAQARVGGDDMMPYSQAVDKCVEKRDWIHPECVEGRLCTRGQHSGQERIAIGDREDLVPPG